MFTSASTKIADNKTMESEKNLKIAVKTSLNFLVKPVAATIENEEFEAINDS